MCKYSHLVPGQYIPVIASAVCQDCGKELRFHHPSVYAGHVTNKWVYDKFDLTNRFTCDCGCSVESVHIACDTGASGAFGKLFARKETAQR